MLSAKDRRSHHCGLIRREGLKALGGQPEVFFVPLAAHDAGPRVAVTSEQQVTDLVCDHVTQNHGSLGLSPIYTLTEVCDRDAASAERAGQKEVAGAYEAEAALREALFGNAAQARQCAEAALALSTGRDVEAGAALALDMAGDRAQAEKLADDLAKRFPGDTYVQYNWLPTIHSQLALNGSNPPKAIEGLEAAARYELGAHYTGAFPPAMYPVYVRGQAYLAARRGGDAALEFQKILDHPGIVLNEPIGALAHLGLARAYALSGDNVNARAKYQDFLALWKDADPDIPVLKQAKTEYAQLP